MNNGTIPESAVYVAGGLIAILVIVGIVLGVVIQIRKLQADGQAEKASLAAKVEAEKLALAAKAEAELLRVKAEASVAIEVARAEAAKETASKIAFEQLTKAVRSMDDTVGKLSKGVGDQIDGIKREQDNICRRVDRVADSVRSAHKRMDEHRKVDHSFPNGHYVEPDDETNPEPTL